MKGNLSLLPQLVGCGCQVCDIEMGGSLPMFKWIMLLTFPGISGLLSRYFPWGNHTLSRKSASPCTHILAYNEVLPTIEYIILYLCSYIRLWKGYQIVYAATGNEWVKNIAVDQIPYGNIHETQMLRNESENEILLDKSLRLVFAYSVCTIYIYILPEMLPPQNINFYST